MQDSYLFRGKRLDNGEWVYGSYAEESNGHFIIVKRGHWGEVDRDTIGQCTGLHAAKSYRGDSEADRLVFDKDIIKYQDELYIVFDFKYAWRVTSLKEYQEEYSDTDSMSSVTPDDLDEHEYNFFIDGEIIGNIHDRMEEATC